MFKGAKAFKGGIGRWDVSSARNMSEMFCAAEAFSGGISKWNVSNVMDMSGMFYDAVSFKGRIGSWDVSNVVDMREMFSAEAGNQLRSTVMKRWNTGKCQTHQWFCGRAEH